MSFFVLSSRKQLNSFQKCVYRRCYFVIKKNSWATLYSEDGGSLCLPGDSQLLAQLLAFVSKTCHFCKILPILNLLTICLWTTRKKKKVKFTAYCWDKQLYTDLVWLQMWHPKGMSISPGKCLSFTASARSCFLHSICGQEGQYYIWMH